MEKATNGWTLGELAQVFGGELRGPEDLRILRPAPADSDDGEGLAFAASEAYLKAALVRRVGALLVPRETPPIDRPAIAVDDPRACFGRFLAMCRRRLPLDPGIHAGACVDLAAEIDPSARIGAFAVVEAGARVGPGCRVYPFAYIGENCTLDEGATIYPHAVLYQDVRVGARSIIHAGTILGADGFGYVWDGQRRVKVPQVGGVEIGADVEIGALSAVDRATAGDTRLGDGVKLDNLVQIAHNCTIGEHTVMASFCGISGSTTVGARVVMGGQTGTSDHVNIADDCILGGRTGVTKDIKVPGAYWGTPAMPFQDALRTQALSAKLPEFVARIKALERRVAELEKTDDV